MGEMRYRKTLEYMELSAKMMEELNKSEQIKKAERKFKETLEKLWPSKSNEKPS